MAHKDSVMMPAERTGDHEPRDSHGRDPLAILEREHAHHQWMCDNLESIADGLPDLVDRGLCAMMAKTLRVDLPAHHRGEEKGLFTLLVSRARPEDGIAEIVAQLSREHALDEGFAEELGELLEDLSRGVRPQNPEMAGYMLRGFFESYRRHIQWEEVVILPLARRRLTQSDLDQVASRLEHRQR